MAKKPLPYFYDGAPFCTDAYRVHVPGHKHNTILQNLMQWHYWLLNLCQWTYLSF